MCKLIPFAGTKMCEYKKTSLKKSPSVLRNLARKAAAVPSFVAQKLIVRG